MGRIGYNVHATDPNFNKGELIDHLRELQPTWMLVMDGMQVCKDIKAALPSCNVIHRAWPDEEIYKEVSAVDWVHQKLGEIQGADVWAYTVNEMGWGDQLVQWFIDVVKEAAKANLKVVIGNCSVGTPTPEEWSKPLSLELLRLLDEHRDIAVMAVHEYACGVITSGFLGGYPDNAGVAPGEDGGVNLIPPENWPSDTHSFTRWHMGRAETFLYQACDDNGIPRPRMIITEWGFDDVSDIKPWSMTLPMTEPYTTIRGWKSCVEAWKAWWQESHGWDAEEAYFEQLRYADQEVYQGTTFEGQLVYCWGHSSSNWDQFDVRQAITLQDKLVEYAQEDTDEETPPDTGDGDNGEETPVGKIDLLPCFKPTNGHSFDLNHRGAQIGTGWEKLIFEFNFGGMPDAWRMRKNANWESFCLRTMSGVEEIGRYMDTSAGRNPTTGREEVYILKRKLANGSYENWPAWIHRFMAIGERCDRLDTWVFFHDRETGAPVASKPPYLHQSYLVLEDYRSTYTIPFSGLVVHNAAIITGYEMNGHKEETYVFAEGYGLVYWTDGRGNESAMMYDPSRTTPVPLDAKLEAWATPPPPIPPPTSGTTPPQPTPPQKPANAGDPVSVLIDKSGWRVRAEPDTSSTHLGYLQVGQSATIYRTPAPVNDGETWHWAEQGSLKGYTAYPVEAAPEPPDPEEPTVEEQIEEQLEIIDDASEKIQDLLDEDGE